MADWLDIVTLVVTVWVVHGSIKTIIWLDGWSRALAISATNCLESKGLSVSSRGACIKVSSYSTYEDYVNAHRRIGFEFAHDALSKHANHRIALPSDASSCSLQ